MVRRIGNGKEILPPFFFASKRCYLRQCCFFKRSHMACIKEIMWTSGLEINADRENTLHFKLKFKTIDTHQRLGFLIFLHSEMALCREHRTELSNSSSNCTGHDNIFRRLNQSFFYRLFSNGKRVYLLRKKTCIWRNNARKYFGCSKYQIIQKTEYLNYVVN